MLLDQLLDPMRCHPWLLLSLVVSLAGCGQAAVQPPSPAASSPAAAPARALRLASGPVAFHTRDVVYLQVDGKTFQATVYQPEGPGPFPAILSVHGGAWVR
jgi:acetyl esterase/lipase